MLRPDVTNVAIEEVYAYLRVHDASQAIEFYALAFGAKELFRLSEPGGRSGHAEIEFGPVTGLARSFVTGLCGAAGA